MRIDGIVIIVDRDINDIDDNSDNSDNNDISDIGVINDGNDNDVIIVGIIWIGWSGYRFLILSVLNLVSMGVEISYSKSYFRLDAWVLANVVQLATQSFCRRFVSFMMTRVVGCLIRWLWLHGRLSRILRRGVRDIILR